jgi:hypothetical protein
MTDQDLRLELERLHAFILRLAERIYAAHEVLANLAERRRRDNG